MKELVISIPKETDEKEVKMLIGASLFEKGILSSGQAAELVGISRRLFLEEVGKHGVSIFGETMNDLEVAEELDL